MMKSCLTILLSILWLATGFAQSSQFDVLLFTKTEGWHHESIKEGVNAIHKLGEKHKFSVNWEEMTRDFTDEGLEGYDAIIFLNTTGNVLNEEQQAAMERFIQSGKGFVGIHSAADTEHDWPWYTQLVGRMFETHPAIQTAKIEVEDAAFPGLELHPKTRWWTDEWYVFKEETVNDLNYLITVDEATYHAEAEGIDMGEFHPISWYHEFDGGRSFYTAMGHVAETYSDDIFLEHIFGGIIWAATGKGLE